jgi:hypothetical protein
MAAITLEEGKKILAQIKAKAQLKYSSKEFVSLGKQRYEQIKEQVEAKHKNKFIVIEVESGEYFIDKDPVQAIVKARKKFPDAIFYRARIGYPAAFSIKSNISLL